jgi:hypothetical protein
MAPAPFTIMPSPVHLVFKLKCSAGTNDDDDDDDDDNN